MKYVIKDVMKKLKAQGQTLADIQHALTTIIKQERDMATKFDDATGGIQASIDEMKKDLVDMNAEIDADRVAFEGLAATNAAQAAIIKELMDAGGTPEQLAKLAELKVSLDEQDAVRNAALARLTKARVDNTTAPAEPPSA